MKDLERIHYLIAQGEAENARQWARKVAKHAFSEHYHLRSFRHAVKSWKRPTLDVLELATAQHNHHHPSC